MSLPPTNVAPAADDEAMAWALRMAEPAADWDAFMDWLEGDADRAARYDRAVFALDEAAAVVAALPAATITAADDDWPEPAVARSPRRGRGLVGGAVAAVLALAIGWSLREPAGAIRVVETPQGVQRSVALADGSRITLAGGSRLRLDGADPRSARVEAGEALFAVRHDAARPFRVDAGGLRMTDLGTTFDVRVLAGQTRVEVSEGAVMVDPDGAALRLDPGQGALASRGRVRRVAVEPRDVGGWRTGRLSYDGATLADVASDLSRQLGRRIATAPAIAQTRFNGTLETEALRDDPALLGALLSVTVRQDGEGWTLEPRR